MYRYVAVVWNPRHQNESETADHVQQRITDCLQEMQTAISAPGLVVRFHRAASQVYEHYVLSGQGAILGKIFPKDTTGSVRNLRDIFGDSQGITSASTAAHNLLRHWWGRYVAFIRDVNEGATHVLRDPSGGLQCFILAFKGIRIIFSDVEDCIALKLVNFSVNWRYIRACLTGRDIQPETTGLNEITQLRPSEILVIRDNGRAERALCWDPMRISEQEPLEEIDVAVPLAKSCIQSCVAAWASCYSDILLRYSGGFDSTIVLSCLRQASSRPTITCLHYFDDPQTRAAGHSTGRRATPGWSHSRRVTARTKAPLLFTPLFPAWASRVCLKACAMQKSTPEDFRECSRVGPLARFTPACCFLTVVASCRLSA